MTNLYRAIKAFINEWKKYDNLNYLKLQAYHTLNTNEHNALGHLLSELYLKYV